MSKLLWQTKIIEANATVSNQNHFFTKTKENISLDLLPRFKIYEAKNVVKFDCIPKTNETVLYLLNFKCSLTASLGLIYATLNSKKKGFSRSQYFLQY